MYHAHQAAALNVFLDSYVGFAEPYIYTVYIQYFCREITETMVIYSVFYTILANPNPVLPFLLESRAWPKVDHHKPVHLALTLPMAHSYALTDVSADGKHLGPLCHHVDHHQPVLRQVCVVDEWAILQAAP